MSTATHKGTRVGREVSLDLLSLLILAPPGVITALGCDIDKRCPRWPSHLTVHSAGLCQPEMRKKSYLVDGRVQGRFWSGCEARLFTYSTIENPLGSRSSEEDHSWVKVHCLCFSGPRNH